MMAMKKTLQALCDRYPDKIELVSDESRSGDGYWLYLRPGWIRERCDVVHSVHEWNMRDLKQAMRQVVPCECEECQTLKAETPCG